MLVDAKQSYERGVRDMTVKKSNRDKLINQLEKEAQQSKIHMQSIESDQKIKEDRHHRSIEKTQIKCREMFISS